MQTQKTDDHNGNSHRQEQDRDIDKFNSHGHGVDLANADDFIDHLCEDMIKMKSQLGHMIGHLESFKESVALDRQMQTDEIADLK